MKKNIKRFKIIRFKIILLNFLIFFGFGFFNFTFAGNIDPVDKYAWSQNIGWINFGTPEGNVTVTDTVITGYAWNSNFGWINLSPATAGVLNNGNGVLSGYAWGEKIGWINFSGVTINSEGYFQGYASGDITGQISFNCANTNTCSFSDFKVRTNWRLSASIIPPSQSLYSPLPPALPEPPVLPEPPAPPSPAPPSVLPEPAISPSPTKIQIIKEKFSEFVKEVKEIIETSIGSITSKIISTVGLAVGALAITSSLFLSSLSSLSFRETFLIPFKLFNLLMSVFGLKKRIKPWGTVYDSITKQPLDPAYVILENLEGKEVASSITDLDGRYGFLVSSGVYRVIANKTNYRFPSQKLAGKIKDELYDNLYFGEPIQISKSGEVITRDIPLDSEKFDWNEFIKKKKKLLKFYSHFDIFLRRFFDILFILGFFVAVVSLIFAPHPYNIIIFSLYVFVLVLRLLGIKPRAYGLIYEKGTGYPLSFAIIRVFSADLNREIYHRVTDHLGRYYLLVPKGRYYLKIEKKNDDGSYSLIYTSPVIDAKQGIIKTRFTI